MVNPAALTRCAASGASMGWPSGSILIKSFGFISLNNTPYPLIRSWLAVPGMRALMCVSIRSVIRKNASKRYSDASRVRSAFSVSSIGVSMEWPWRGGCRLPIGGIRMGMPMGLRGFDQHRPVARAGACLAQRPPQCGGIVCPAGIAAKTAREQLKIRRVQVPADGSYVALAHVASDFFVAAVVPQQDDGGQAGFDCTGQFGQCELQAAITDQAHHGAVWRCELGADGRRQAIAQSPVARGRVEPAPRPGHIDGQIALVHGLGGVAGKQRIG